MSEENNPINIELRSEEIQDILNRAPNWMIRWGNSVLILIVLAAFLLSYFIEYPDVISGRAVISTNTPPVYAVSKVNGRIDRLLVENGKFVKRGDIIAEIDNPIPFSSIEYLESFLEKGEQFLLRSTKFQRLESDPVDLYDASTEYLNLRNTLEEYSAFLFDNNASRQLMNLKTKRSNYLKIREISLKEIELNKVDIENAKEKFKMQNDEFKLGYISNLDFLNAQSAYNQSLKSGEVIKKNIIQMDMTLADYEDQINTFNVDRNKQAKAYKKRITELISTLKNYVIRWNNDFTIKSPVSGRIDYLGRVKANQLISAGDELFAIVPPGGDYEVELEIPSTGFGKVKVGQIVKLKLDNFPFDEFGLINGVVSGLPVLPNQDIYKIKVDLTKGLETSYGIDLNYSPEMLATAEIITEDLRLIERLFNSLRSILVN